MKCWRRLRPSPRAAFPTPASAPASRARFRRLLAVAPLSLLLLAGAGELRSAPAIQQHTNPGPAAAAPQHTHVGTAQAQLERFGRNLQNLQARFQQLVVGTDGQVLERGEGQLWLSKPNLFRWRLEGEFPELIVADGERLWLFDESLEQVTVRNQVGLDMDSPLLLLSDLSALERQFRLAELGEIDGRALLELTPLAAEAEFERVILGLEKDLPVTMLFEDLQRNSSLARDLFLFEPPAGVDLVGDLEGLPRDDD